MKNRYTVLNYTENHCTNSNYSFKEKSSSKPSFRALAKQFVLFVFLLFSVIENGWGQFTVNTAGPNNYQWTCPAGVTSITVQCWGAGGRGGTRSGANGAGGGGGGGAYSSSVINVTPGVTYYFTNGAGSSTTNPGGDSYFGNTIAGNPSGALVLAKGGASAADNSTAGANGGSAANGIGTIKYNGGNGWTTVTNSGGGGGSSAGSSVNGNNASSATGATAPAGGAAGGNGATSNANGSAGANNGGGGGGAYRTNGTKNGGAGARGRVSITYTLPNNICDNAIALTVGASSIYGTLNGSLQEAPFINDFCAGFGYCGGDVWFKFTASCSALYTVNLTGLTSDEDLFVYTACGASSYTFSGEATSTLSETATINAISGTTYYIQVYDYDNNGGSFNIAVTGPSSTTPTVAVTSSDADNIFCSGTNVTFSAAASNLAGGVVSNYQWKLNGVNVGTNLSTYSNSSLSNNDIVSCVATITGGTCLITQNPSSNSITNAVNASPTSVTVTGGAICSGGTITASGGTGGTIYWQGTTSGGTSTSSGSGTTSPAITSAGTYYAVAQSSAGCWGTQGSAAVTLTPVPLCTSTGIYPSDGNLSVNPSGVVVLSWDAVLNATGYNVYLDGVLVSTNQNGLSYTINTVTPSTPYQWRVEPRNSCGIASGCSTYSFTTSASGCTPPTINSLTLTNILCFGQSTGQIVVNASGGQSGYTYSINNWGSSISTNTFSGLTAGNYTVYIKGGDGCEGAISTISLTGPASALSVSASGGGAGCAGSTLSLSSSVSGGTSGYSYLWTNAPGLSSGTTANPTATIGSFASHSVTVTDANGCQATSNSVSITNNSPNAPTASNPAAICVGESANLVATSAGNSINWYDQPTGGNLITSLVPSGTNYLVSPASTTTYYAAAVTTATSTPTTVSKTFTGANETWTVPQGVYSINVKMWGAGGAGGQYDATYLNSGGSGGYVSGSLAVTPGQVLNLIVGAGGKTTPNNTVSQYGGGGSAGSTSTSFYTGGGGGRSAIQLVSGTDYVTVGGGGGAGNSRRNSSYTATIGVAYGGAGGGNTGGPSGVIYGGAIITNSTTPAYGGTQSSGGIGGTNPSYTNSNGGNGAQYLGGNGVASSSSSYSNGGGGGGGYYGGGGGAVDSYGGGSQGGGGGSSYTANLTGVTNTQGAFNSAGAQAGAPNNTDANYIAGVGIGGAGGTSNNGGNGLIVISYTQPVAGCVSTTRTAVTVTVNPAPTANAGSSMAAICSGSTSAALGGSVGGSATSGTWTHNGAGSIANATNASTATYTAGASESGTITLTLTTTGGTCIPVTVTKTIVVNALPAAPTAPVNLTICQAGSGNISVTAPTFSGTQNISFNIATEPTETNIAPGNQIATTTISALPTGTSITSAALTVNNLTALSSSWMSDVYLGLSGAVTYTAVAGSSTNTAGSFNYSSNVTSSFTVNTSTTTLNLLYWDAVSDNSGVECTFGAPKTANLTLNYSYPATINWYSAATGGTLLGTGASFNPIGTTVLPNSNTPGTYNFYAEATNNGCTSGRVLVTVTITASTAISAQSTAGQTVCQNGTFTPITVTATGTGTLTYQWYSNTTASTTGGTSLGTTSGAQTNSYTPSSAVVGTKYYYCVVNGTCGSATSIISGAFVVNPLTAISAQSTAGQTVCQNGTITPITVTATGTGTLTYQWYSNTTASTTGGTSLGSTSGAQTNSYTPSSATAGTKYYYCVVTGTCGSVTSAISGAFVVNSLPIVAITPSANAICSGQSSTLTASGANSYVWNTTETTTNIMASAAGTYSVIGTDGNGCTASANTTISANAAPTVSAGADKTICIGNSVTLSGSGAATYTWSNGVTNGTAFTPTSTATYTVTGTDLNGCTNTDQVVVTLPTAGSSLSTHGENATCAVSENGWVDFYNLTTGNLVGSINSLGQDLGNVTITSYVDTANTLVPACNDASNPSLMTSVLRRHWVITPSIQPNDTVFVRLPHSNAEYMTLSGAASTNQNPNDDIVNQQDLDLTKYSNGSASNVNSSALDNCGVGTSTFHQQTQYGSTTSYSSVNENYATFAITGFSEFWLHGSAQSSPLPVELVNFQANCAGEGKVNVTWATASEHNSANFTVEKSRDGINWTVLATVAGAGNSTQMINYSVDDNNAAAGVNYYRLTQTDFDGASETFNIASANCSDNSTATTVKVYPNPSAGDFYIDFTSEEMLGESVITITDSRGSEIYSQSVTVEKGSNVFHIEQLDAAPGLYYIKVSNGTTTSNIVKHSLR